MKRDPEAWGVATGYRDAGGQWREVPATTVDAVLDALGADRERPEPNPRVMTVGAGSRARVGEGRLTTEDGGEMRVRGALPADLPLGYHRLERDDVPPVTVVVSPVTCHLPPGLREWGWALQLYGLRSSRSWGIGDLGDLEELARWSAEDLDAGFVLVNPLHAGRVTHPQRPSPYFPSSRRFRNPLYLRLDGEAPPAVSKRDRRIDYDVVFAAKMAALEDKWTRFGGDAGFERYCEREGAALERYAAFCVLSEHHGASWRAWPASFRHPSNPAVTGFARDHADRVRFHQWLQWLLEGQLERAGRHLDVVHDLAVGIEPDGADAWLWQDTIAPGISVGAPPDEFNTLGQDWGLAAPDPWQLGRLAHEPFVQTLRAALSSGGGLRIDHVMGLFRLYWIPAGAAPSEGTYVRYPAAQLLDILALESQRNEAYVIGEDLGTVEAEVRAELARRRVLSYRVLWFEEEAPAEYPAQALASVTTHDLPTVAGLWTGSDLRAQRALGLAPNEEGVEGWRRRLVALARESVGIDDVVDAVYGELAEAPSALLAATLDDVLGVAERPNMPGTIDEWPNWSLALPMSLEEIEADPRPRRVAALLSRRRV